MRTLIHRRTLIWFACLCFVSIPSLIAQESPQPRSTLRAMSFNIRLGVADDGANHWEKRKSFVAETIRNFDPDFVGTQETWDFQAQYLDQTLPDHTYIGRSRQSDGKGEHCGILYRTERFDRLIEGHFWLSTTPEKPGSKSWDSSLPRMATWLKLWDRVNQQSVYVINTHFDHRGTVARSESAQLIRRFISQLPANAHVVVTGDFNASVGSTPYKSLFSPLEGNSPVVDSYLQVDHQQTESGGSAAEGTFNGFKGVVTGARIDWIATTPNLDVISAGIDRSTFEGRYPSDHFPVTAELRFQDTP